MSPKTSSASHKRLPAPKHIDVQGINTRFYEAGEGEPAAAEDVAAEDATPQATAADDEAQAVAGGDDAQADDVTKPPVEPPADDEK